MFRRRWQRFGVLGSLVAAVWFAVATPASGCWWCGRHRACGGCASERRGCGAVSDCATSARVQTGCRASTNATDPRGGEANAGENVAMLTVKVPADAKVYVDDTPTQSKGAKRQFVSPQLDDDTDYTYDVRVEVTRDGERISKSKTVRVQAGKETMLEFRLSDDDDFPRLIVASIR